MNNDVFLNITRILIVECVNTEEKNCIILGELLQVNDEDVCRDRELNMYII